MTLPSSPPVPGLPAAPVAERRPHSSVVHGVTLNDPYHWLRDQGYPEVTDNQVLAYLNAENAYFDAAIEPHAKLIETLAAEMRGRIAEQDASVPVRDGGYVYWHSFDAGQDYRKWYRRPVAGGSDELLLDENILAAGHDNFSLGTIQVSPNGTLLAYSTDTDGSERYTIHVRDLSADELCPDSIPNMRANIVWSADSKQIFYTPVDENWRSKLVKVHRLGTDSADDQEVAKELEDGMELSIGQTQSRRFMTISAGDHVSNAVSLVALDDLTAAPIEVAPRQTNRLYDVEEHDALLYILTNDGHVNFRIMTASLEQPGNWKELHAGSDNFYVTGLTTFADFYVVEGRDQGLDQLEIWTYGASQPDRVPFPEPSYTASLGPVAEFNVDSIRVKYESMVTPATDFSYEIGSGALTTLKVQQIPSGYDPADYVTERLMIEARDGVQVPVSLVHRRDTDITAETPLHLYAYGAYGYAVPPRFSTRQLSLTNRGFVFAIAHVRGGDDLGYQWYLDGKLKSRTNTFNDFVDIARGLIARGYSSAGRIVASGGSAGGELMGAIVNSDPDIWGAVVAEVPFVDVLNTMLDESLPLTPGEWPEWGNPIVDADAFRLILSYSPYDNVTAQDYPPIMITAGLNDPRVTYWEPAKWAARLRALRTDDKLTVLRTNMGAGHQGQSGRFQSLHEEAQSMAFMLAQLGLASA